MKQHLFLLLVFPFFLSCHDAENKKNVRAAAGIYYEYQIWAEEGREDVTVRLQFKTGGEEGEAFTPEESVVLLDGKPVKSDSSRFNGPYYELVVPLTTFGGRHTIVFIDKDKKENKNEFRFTPFSLTDELPETIKRGPFSIQLKDLPSPATIRLVMADTSLRSRGVNEKLMVSNGVVNVTEEQLTNLANGPVTLEIYKEDEKPLTNGSEGRGKISITYAIRRQFELIN